MSQKDFKSEVTGKLVALVNLQTEMEAEMLMDVLRQENISVMTKDHGTGAYMKLYMGYSIYGETLYVYDYDYPRAREIMLALQQGSEEAIHLEQQTHAEVFADADGFDQYEVEQFEKREAEAGIPKRNSPIPLIAVILLLLFLFTILR